MSRNISVLSGKPTFGTLRQQLDQSDYITRKKGLKTFCNNKNICNKLPKSKSYDKINSFNWGKYTASVNNCINGIPINKSSLIMGQYSKLDLNGVCDISFNVPCNTIDCNRTCTGIPITSDGVTPFYAIYNIDPKGELFGNSQCGSLNYTHYTKFKPSPNFLVYNRVT
jgi:hypothetical protein